MAESPVAEGGKKRVCPVGEGPGRAKPWSSPSLWLGSARTRGVLHYSTVQQQRRSQKGREAQPALCLSSFIRSLDLVRIGSNSFLVSSSLDPNPDLDRPPSQWLVPSRPPASRPEARPPGSSWLLRPLASRPPPPAGSRSRTGRSWPS